MPAKTRTNPYALPRQASPRVPSPTQKQATPVTGKPASVGRQTKCRTPSGSQTVISADQDGQSKGKGRKDSNTLSNASKSRPKSNSPVSSPAAPLFLEDDLDDLNGGGGNHDDDDNDDDDDDYNHNDENSENHDEDFDIQNNKEESEHSNNEFADPNEVDDDDAAAAASGSGENLPPGGSALTPFLNGERLRNFNKLAKTAGLNDDFKVMGRVLCNLDGSADDFTSLSVALLSARQEIRNYHEEANGKITQLLESLACLTAPKAGWTASHELRQTARMIATQCIITGDVQAYTATANKEGSQEHLPRSLCAKLMAKILDNPSEWRKRLLPARYGKNPDPVDSRDFQKWINVILKEIRKDLNKILLTNIHLPIRVKKTPSKLNVPTIETLIVKASIYEREHDFIGGKVRVREEILPGNASYIHWGWNTQDYSNKTFWGVVDEKLEELRSKSVRYRYAFFLEVLRQDFDRFDGERTFAEIQKTTKFELPTEEEVQAQIQHLEETHGARVVPAELDHTEAV
ncbi:uncharacterized protein MELLADRAFT_92540 [Melampsora larici-populina 98AG31]|uniref:Uncharacterized protein n=1 Tax=Melampsora larici-populina (strain 98AG31 / pathotype 3-4-7) TaxID=747676 RepID=F4S1X2_MELLP|nr:uncharacterized protein MELLADRAFT_92540 [Melampsora larici-populina 98AG31]EGG01267.1 hypothetical protein MELLADRAFT_92540 [Melampsora larici-populina 98AG31]